MNFVKKNIKKPDITLCKNQRLTSWVSKTAPTHQQAGHETASDAVLSQVISRLHSAPTHRFRQIPS